MLAFHPQAGADPSAATADAGRVLVVQTPSMPDDDSTIAIVRAAARASLLSLRDDLVVARHSTLAAVADVPSTPLDWFGPASQSLRDALDRLGTRLEDTHADLASAVPLLDRAI